MRHIMFGFQSNPKPRVVSSRHHISYFSPFTEKYSLSRSIEYHILDKKRFTIVSPQNTIFVSDFGIASNQSTDYIIII